MGEFSEGCPACGYWQCLGDCGSLDYLNNDNEEEEDDE